MPALGVVPKENTKYRTFNYFKSFVLCFISFSFLQNKQRNKDRKKDLIVLSVLMRIQWGIGLFCLIFFASFFLILNVLCDGYINTDIKTHANDQQKSFDSIKTGSTKTWRGLPFLLASGMLPLLLGLVSENTGRRNPGTKSYKYWYQGLYTWIYWRLWVTQRWRIDSF